MGDSGRRTDQGLDLLIPKTLTSSVFWLNTTFYQYFGVDNLNQGGVTIQIELEIAEYCQVNDLLNLERRARKSE